MHDSFAMAKIKRPQNLVHVVTNVEIGEFRIQDFRVDIIDILEDLSSQGAKLIAIEVNADNY